MYVVIIFEVSGLFGSSVDLACGRCDLSSLWTKKIFLTSSGRQHFLSAASSCLVVEVLTVELSIARCTYTSLDCRVEYRQVYVHPV